MANFSLKWITLMKNSKMINPILKNTYKKYKMKNLSCKSITPIQKYRKMATFILQKNIKSEIAVT